MQKKQTALVKSPEHVLYRHTCMGETKFAFTGEALPESSQGPGMWEAYTEDNARLGEGDMAVLLGKGFIHAAIFINMPEVGKKINLKYGKSNLPDGQYRITEVKWGIEYVHVFVERVGEIDPTRLIHILRLWSC